MFNRVRSLIGKELIQFSRDKLLLIATLIGPMVQFVLVGGSTGGGLTGLPIAVVDRDNSATSREVVAALDNTQELAVKFYPPDLEQAEYLLDNGRASGVVVIPEQFGEHVRAGEAPQVQLVVDGSNVVAAADALSAAQGAVVAQGYQVQLASAGEGLSPQGIDLRQEALYNQALDEQPYETTAHLAFFTFLVVTLAAVMGIVRERELGTMEQVMITPLRQVELIAGKAIGPLVIGVINFVVMYVMAWLIFGIPMRGSYLLLTLMLILYLVSEVCVALMISTISRTQQQAITVVFVWIMFALTMSGFLVPITQLPAVLQILANILPLQHFIEIVRSVMLKGAGLVALWPNIAALVGLDVVVIAVTSVMLRRLGR